MKGFIVLRPKTYPYLTDDGQVDKKAKSTKKCIIKRETTFQDHNDYLENVFTEKVNKIALRVNDDDERKQTRDGIFSFPYGIDPEIKYKE